MGCVRVEWVLEVPEPMNEEQFRHWESINRPPKMLWLKEVEPVGASENEVSNLWRCVYEECDEYIAELCS